MGIINGRFLGMDSGTMSEAYSGAADDGLWEGVNMTDHTGGSYAANGMMAPAPNMRMAWLIIVGAIAALWFLGGIVFRVSIR
jgi:hypothetical protein